ncbi:Zinc finger, SWIM-type domain-containing protein [Strongyloides ratti]|uniref:Zinc finger, SWIM-type domain-containing protein n=1 Tax=Strongyloides ratti TaxID=34506 RepID=A0A090KWE5_STRRB|nr:Zinc finger, SWIM-type domain-containing protein [Strongyloides ratti]CEF61825.1 Zinc finger, SWIM-type domain-containing protein [Strongyloides ratti]
MDEQSFDDQNGKFALTFSSIYKTPLLREYVQNLKSKKARRLSDISADVLGKRFTFDDLNELYRYHLRTSTSEMKEIWGEPKEGMLPDDFVKVIMPYTFPKDIGEIYHWTVLNNGSPTNFYEGLSLFEGNAVTSVIQVGFTLTAHVIDRFSQNIYCDSIVPIDKEIFKNVARVFISFERQFISRADCTCTEGPKKGRWCSHIVAATIMRIVKPYSVKIDIPIIYQLQNKNLDEAKNICMHIIPNLTPEKMHDLFNILENIDCSKPNNILSQGFIDVTTGMGHGTILTKLRFIFQTITPIILSYDDIHLNLNVVDYESLAMPLHAASLTEQTVRFLKLTSNNKSLINLSSSLMKVQEMVYKFENCGLYASLVFLIRILDNDRIEKYIASSRDKSLNVYRSIFGSECRPRIDMVAQIINMCPETVEKEAKIKIIYYIINECGSYLRHYIHSKDITKNDLLLLRHLCFVILARHSNILYRNNSILEGNTDSFTNIYKSSFDRQILQTIKECNIVMYDKYQHIDNETYFRGIRNLPNYENELKNNLLLQVINEFIDKSGPIYRLIFEPAFAETIYLNSTFPNVEQLIEMKNRIYNRFDIKLICQKNNLFINSSTTYDYVNFIKDNLQDWVEMKKNIDKIYFCKNDINQNQPIEGILCCKCKYPIDGEHEDNKNILKEKYREIYTNIKLIYDMTLVIGKDMLYMYKIESFCDLIFSVLSHPRPFLFDDDEEVYIWAVQDKLFSLIETGMEDNDCQYIIIKTFFNNFEKIFYLCKIAKDPNNRIILNISFLIKMSTYCENYLQNHGEVNGISIEEFKKKYYVIICSSLEYRPNVKECDFPLFYECYYITRRHIIIECIRKASSSPNILHVMVNQILDTNYGHLYSDHRANCYSLDPEKCCHNKKRPYQKCYGLYARHMVQLTKCIFIAAGGSFDSAIFFDFDGPPNGRGIRNDILYKIALLFACYVGSLKVQGNYLHNREHVNYVFTVFRPYDNFHPEAMNVLKIIKWENCFRPMEMYALLTTAMQSNNDNIIKSLEDLYIQILKHIDNLRGNAAIDMLNFLKLRKNDDVVYKGLCSILDMNKKINICDFENENLNGEYIRNHLSFGHFYSNEIDGKIYYESGKQFLLLFMKGIYRKITGKTNEYIEDHLIPLWVDTETKTLRDFRNTSSSDFTHEIEKLQHFQNLQYIQNMCFQRTQPVNNMFSQNGYSNNAINNGHQARYPRNNGNNIRHDNIINHQMPQIYYSPLQNTPVDIPSIFLDHNIFCAYNYKSDFNEMSENPLVKNIPINYDYFTPHFETFNSIILTTPTPLNEKEITMLDGAFDLLIRYLFTNTDNIFSKNYVIKNCNAPPNYRHNVMYICEFSCHLGPLAISTFLDAVTYTVNYLDLICDIYRVILPLAFVRKINQPYKSRFVPPIVISWKDEEKTALWSENFFVPSSYFRNDNWKKYGDPINLYRKQQPLVVEIDQELLKYIENNYKTQGYPEVYGRFAKFVAQLLYVRLNYMLMGNMSLDGMNHEFEKFIKQTTKIFGELFVINNSNRPFTQQLLKKFFGNFRRQNGFKRDAYNCFKSKLNPYIA